MATVRQNIPRRFEVLQDRPLGAVDRAALAVAGRQWAGSREQLEPGDHQVWLKVLITGGISLGEPEPAATAADYLGVLAFVLSKLPANQRAAVAHAVSQPGWQVTKADREIAREICRPTQGQTVRGGKLTGSLQIEAVR